MKLTLPENVRLLRYDTGIIITGPGLSQRVFQSVVMQLSEKDKQNVIGWTKTATKVFC
jgi:hypothetical protein